MTPNPNPVHRPPVTPKDAASLILLRTPEDPHVFWVKRARTLKFLAGFHAFPGGQVDAGDVGVPIDNCPADDDLAGAVRVCAIREIFEETGVLLARGAERIPPMHLGLLRRLVTCGQISFEELLVAERLTLDATCLQEAPRWVTPPTMPRRFDTRFFAAWLPEGQQPVVIPGELECGEWIRPAEALRRWTEGECLIVTPLLTAMQALAEGVADFAARMQSVSQATRDLWEQRVEMRKGFFLCAQRTPTIPPATHTNCLVIGGEELVIIDPGSPYPDEQARFDRVLDSFLAEGRRLREILITHLHPDHIGGVTHVAEKYGLPVAAHSLTAQAISGEVRVDRLVEDDELIVLRNRRDALEWRLRALWTPGHARGHLSFYEERTGTLLTGDCVVGLGTVVIAPPEGKLSDYLASLQHYLSLPKLTALFPGHGPIIADARGKIEAYIAHRQQREAQILAALQADATTIPQVVKMVYTEVAPEMHGLAACSVLAHLEKLLAEGRVERMGEGFALAERTSCQ